LILNIFVINIHLFEMIFMIDSYYQIISYHYYVNIVFILILLFVYYIHLFMVYICMISLFSITHSKNFFFLLHFYSLSTMHCYIIY